jgi:regulatory protein
VVAWLEGLGYLDDAAFARARARALAGSGRVGPRLAAQRLARAGVPPADARRAVDAAFAEEGDEAERCRALALRRLRGADPRALDPAGLRRLARFLAGRGFSGSAVARALGVRVDVEVGEDG